MKQGEREIRIEIMEIRNEAKSGSAGYSFRGVPAGCFVVKRQAPSIAAIDLVTLQS